MEEIDNQGRIRAYYPPGRFGGLRSAMNGLYWFLALAGLFYLGAPILLKFQQRMAAHPDLRPIDPADLPPSASRYLQESAHALLKDGFTVSECVALPYPMTGIGASLIMLINRETGDEAMATAIFSTNAATPHIKTSYLEFSTRFEDGHCVNTMNGKLLSSFPPDANDVNSQAPQVQDPNQLYRLHRFVLDRTGPHGKPVVYEKGQAIAYLAQKVLVDSYETQVERGWLMRDASGDAYLPTWKGAYIMTWQQLWPWSLVRRAQMQQKARELLTAFEQSSVPAELSGIA